jgi:flagellum-specific ATP synthase
MRFKQLLSRYQQNEDLITVGAYSKGSDPDTDFAIERMPVLRSFLQQGLNESKPMTQSIQELAMVLSPPPKAPAPAAGVKR